MGGVMLGRAPHPAIQIAGDRSLTSDSGLAGTVLDSLAMDQEAARTARESLDLAFHMSNILDTGLDRHTLSVLIALCDLGVNPEALAAVVRELHREPSQSVAAMPSPHQTQKQ
ncbi:hypothetical protein NL676_001589 [Syzygium grande]|nr:hypothetical protein NL676_001589 [Syzygium grande]